ncbi:head-tail connector protein [Kordiimonas pumila]|uniref:Head-tail connector protein n=1 Tax=Kordiimonas pumila TaxID=2161677 RepID=A0ABV7D3Q2_9PROT|nr:head-tail connector protein [Kordiimonas pumila]
MRTETLLQPAYVPVLLDEVKDHLRIDGAEEDAALGALISTSVTLVETWLDMALINRTVAVYLDTWPETQAGTGTWWNGVADGVVSMLQSDIFHAPLPVRPVSAVASIGVTAADGTTSAWNTDDYYLKPGLAPAIVRKYGRVWPQPGVPADGIKITVTAGFGADWNTVPAGIRQALLMLVTHLYYNRGDTSGDPALKASGALGILAPYRTVRL